MSSEQNNKEKGKPSSITHTYFPDSGTRRTSETRFYKDDKGNTKGIITHTDDHEFGNRNVGLHQGGYIPKTVTTTDIFGQPIKEENKQEKKKDKA